MSSGKQLFFGIPWISAFPILHFMFRSRNETGTFFPVFSDWKLTMLDSRIDYRETT